MAIIKQGILGGFKKKIGSVVGSSWKGKATMRSLPLSVANPKTAAQVENRDRFKTCAEFASSILAPLIKPLMDRFAGQMSGYNYFTKLNKDVFANPENPVWANMLISKGKLLKVQVDLFESGTENCTLEWETTTEDRYALPTDKVYALVIGAQTKRILFAGDTGKTRADGQALVTYQGGQTTDTGFYVFGAFLRADGSEVSTSSYFVDLG